MFTAKRFTTVPTKKCRERLEKAITNKKPICKREKNHAAVMIVQSALANLNKGYLSLNDVDGWFGTRTYNAVENFQRDYGLVADGIVARQTLTQLDSLYSGDVIREPMGVSVHIGVDKVDPKHYGDEFALSSCVNDAEKMQEIAEKIGYDTLLLKNEEATVFNFTSFFRNAIDNLFSGDSLMISFSGHGSQVENVSIDSESDNRDETLCFYDRMFIDDEMYALLSQLREGVRVHLVFDSCHSGTVAKKIDVIELESKNYFDKSIESIKSLTGGGGDSNSISESNVLTKPISSKGILKAIEGDKPKFAKEAKYKTGSDKEIATLFADLFDEENKNIPKSIEYFNGVYERNKMLYDTVKNIIGPKSSQNLECLVTSLSACQDYQATPAGSILSLFTSNINRSWGTSEYQGSYKEFHKSVVENTNRPDVIPAINTYGGSKSEVMLHERPFVI